MRGPFILSTINARYSHASLGLRYLKANLGALADRAVVLEFDLSQRPIDMCERILRLNPSLIGLGVYIWNAGESHELVALLKRLSPETIVVLGGPEVSHETELQEIVQYADYVITGEGDLTFRSLCQSLSQGDRPAQKIIQSPIPEVDSLELPYELYTDEDIAHRTVYVEASRGCAFRCEFCLSSLEIPVRQFPLETFLAKLERLYTRGVRQFKFVDRTFNLNLRTSAAILSFFLARYKPGLFVHFEMIPDRLPSALRELIQQFPPGALQFEVGIQSFNVEVNRLISRRQNVEKIDDNLRFLRECTGVHIHADLIAGLPGESLGSFGAGFDRLVSLRPQEIQVGILKRLRGTPITRHDDEWGMVYSQSPPYEVIQNKLIAFDVMQRVKRFARYWDLVSNSGNFISTCQMLWLEKRSPFHEFLAFSDWLYEKIGARHGIALHTLAEMLRQFLVDQKSIKEERVIAALVADYDRLGRTDRPSFLRERKNIPGQLARVPALHSPTNGRRGNERQQRHLPLGS